MRRAKYLIIHHGAWKDTPEFQADEVRQDQMNRGWNDIAYDFLIENCDGQWFAVIGRPLTIVGGHCLGWNKNSIGICFLGDFNKEKPSELMLHYAIEYLVLPLMQIFQIPAQNVRGHRECLATDCPGNFFDMNQFREMIIREIRYHSSDS